MNQVVDKALQANKESKRLDFKRQFDPSSAVEWCELVKDIIAIANSGGGVILLGLCDDGSASGLLPTSGRTVDPATIDDKIFRYTDQHLPELQVAATQKGTQEVVVLVVPGVGFPIIFTSPGTYAVAGGKQQTAFGRGTIYFRHGAKSEVGTTDDIRSAFERHLSSRREEWLGNIRRVVEAPEGALIRVVPATFQTSPVDQAHVGVRLVHDPTAPTVPHWNPDDTHPYRLKELVANLKSRLSIQVSSFDVQCVRRAYEIDSNPNFFYRSRHGSPQYSDAFLDWMEAELRKDSTFFQKAKGLARDARERLTTD